MPVQKIDGPDIEEYNVLKDNKNIKHGPYIRYRDMHPFGGIVMMESGNYSNGEKNGSWQYFYFDFLKKSSWNSLREKGSYVNGKKNGLWTSFFMDTIPDIASVQGFGGKEKDEPINISIEQRGAKLKQAGMYLNDKRVGEWTSFDQLGHIAQKYNFSKSKLLLEKSLKDSTEYNMNRKPLFIGGLPCLNDFLFRNFKFSDVTSIESDSVYSIISLKIDVNGVLTGVGVSESKGPSSLDKEMIRLVSLSTGNWLPGVMNGQKTDSDYKIRLDIYRVNDSIAGKKISWSISFSSI